MSRMTSWVPVHHPPTPHAGKTRFADEQAAALLAGELEQLCRPRQHGWEVFKHNSSRTVYHGRLGGQEVFLKHYHSRSLLHRLARRLGFSEARREMRYSQYLAGHGVPTAAALAAMCADGVEWLATQAVAPSETAEAWHARQLRLGAAGARAIDRAIVQLARLIGRMHACGVIHRDLHCLNILVRGGPLQPGGPCGAGLQAAALEPESRGGGPSHSAQEVIPARFETPARPIESFAALTEVRAAPQEEPQLVLMDLHRVRRRSKLSRRARAANLAQLFHDRFDFTTRTQRLRFLKHYLQASAAGGSLRGWETLIGLFARRHTRRQNAQRDRRVLGESRYFTRLNLGNGWRGHAVLASKRRMGGSRAAEIEFTADQWPEALGRPDLLLPREGDDIIKDSSSGLVFRRKLHLGGQHLDVFVKRPRRRQAWKILLDCFRPARTTRAFRLGHALLTRRIATSLPLAALERRVGPLLLDSILISEAVAGRRLNDFLDTHLARPPRGDVPLTASQQYQLAQEVLWQMGRMLQRLHDNNFAHRDLKATNMFVRWRPGTPPEVVLIDLDGLKHAWLMSARRRFQGLMRLNVSLLKCPAVNHAGRLRMLLGYLRRPGCGRINFKPYWRVLEQWSASKLNQQIRSRRKRQKAARRPS